MPETYHAGGRGPRTDRPRGPQPGQVTRPPVTRQHPLPTAAVQNELRRVREQLAANPPMHVRPLLLGAACALAWLITDGAPKPSAVYALTPQP